LPTLFNNLFLCVNALLMSGFTDDKQCPSQIPTYIGGTKFYFCAKVYLSSEKNNGSLNLVSYKTQCQSGIHMKEEVVLQGGKIGRNLGQFLNYSTY
jgi:hypothetical protein